MKTIYQVSTMYGTRCKIFKREENAKKYLAKLENIMRSMGGNKGINFANLIQLNVSYDDFKLIQLSD